MSRLFKGFTLNEGYTDLGTLSVDITFVENKIVPQAFASNQPVVTNAPVFQIYDSSKSKPLPGLKVVFTIDKGNGTDREIVSTGYSNADGYVGFPIPPQSTVFISDPDAITLFDTKISGVPESRQEEAYLKVTNDAVDYYTMLGKFFFSKGELGMPEDYTYAGLGISTIGGIVITPAGEIYVYNTSTQLWVSKDPLEFNQFVNPAGLTPAEEGFYTVGTAGAVTTGNLGTGTFSQYSISIVNPTPCPVIISVAVYEPDGVDPIYTEDLDPLDPTTKNITKIQFDYDEPTVSDDTPTISDVATAAGITFSGPFLTFLSTNNLDTVQDVRKAGPLKYLEGIPDPDASEVATLQSYVDLYFLTYELAACTYIRSKGYNTIYDIAVVPRSIFIEDMELADAYTFATARTHQVAVQRVSLISNVLAASLNDNQLNTPVQYASAQAYEIFKPKCGCDDCQSGISPFAYLSDLIKYAAGHVKKTGGYSPTNFGAFVTLIEETFYQPFGSYPVDCDTLHQEFCRVRMATEVLVKLLADSTISTAKQDAFDIEKDQYLQLTYNNLLLQAGSSFDEVRSAYLAPPETKNQLAAKLATKLNIPLFIPGSTTNLTTDKLWLQINGSGDHILDEAHLESVFGFRDTGRDVLTIPSLSLMETWRNQNLKDIWTLKDYPLSSYTREGIDDPTDPTILPEWKPIIDPDMIGLDDMRYFAYAFVPGMYQNRMADTDTFLNYFVDTFNESITVDPGFPGVRVIYPGQCAGDTIEDDTIFLHTDTPSPSWVDFVVNSMTLNGTSTDIKLTTVPGFQPDGTNPMMRYIRVQNVLSNTPHSGSHTLDIVLPKSAIDYLSAGFVKLKSNIPGQTEEYTTTSVTNNFKIDAIDVTGETSVTISFNGGVSFPGSTYLESLTFYYEKEVPLFNSKVPSPAELVDELFNEQQTYHLYSLGTGIDYNMWNASDWSDPLGTDADYDGLKSAYQQLLSGNNIEGYTGIIKNGLYLSNAQFIRMMELLILCENYISSIFNNPAPTIEQLYELASIFRVSAKKSLNPIWIEEEISFEVDSAPVNLKLTYHDFWNSLQEPLSSGWNPLLQTNDLGDARPMVDPEFITASDIHDGPAGEAYKTALSTRIAALVTMNNTLLGYQSYNELWFEKILIKINNNTTTGPYSISGYASLALLLADFETNDAFKIQKATNAAFGAFGMNKTEFLRFIDIKEKYETAYPTVVLSPIEISIAMNLGVLGYKRKQLYTTWLTEESSYKYYNIFKMYLDPTRGNMDDRAEWHKTLSNWNRQPFVDPDIVPAENLVSFQTGDPAFDFWQARLIQLESKRGDFADAFDPLDSASDQLTGIKNLICSVLYGEDFGDITSLNYFLSLQDLENNGENIATRLDQINIGFSEYRYIRKAYDLVKYAVDHSTSVTLIQSEYEDIYDIFLEAEKKQRLFSTYILEEYQQTIIAPDPIPADYPILLSKVEFQNYQPTFNNFPLTDLPVFNTWRSSYQVRRNWLDILESRTKKQNEIEAEWKKVLDETEDITLQSLRNALIRALSNTCEIFDEAADRLAKTLFIETKDNCCVRHTRISQAIETLQGFLFALRNGVYDEALNGFSIIALNFDEEWEWLGSYAAWRSAMFVFLYPENILYPTLKRHQSPAFQQYAKELQDPAKLSPEGACLIAKNYEDYFIDILNLDIKFTTNTKANVFKQKADACCEDTIYNDRITFFFGQSNISGKCYWSQKFVYDETDYSMSFWENLNLPDQTKLIGAYPISREEDENGIPTRREIWLFYSYKKESKLKLAYIKKNLIEAGSKWTDEVEVDIPTEFPYINDTTKNLGEPFAITGCQCSIEWDWMSFIFSYYRHETNGGSYHIHLRFFDQHQAFDLGVPDFGTSMLYYFTQGANNVKPPITAIRHQTGDQNNLNNDGREIYGLSMVFDGFISTVNFAMNNESALHTTIDIAAIGLTEFGSWIGVFQKREEPNILVAAYKNGNGATVLRKIKFNGATTSNVAVDYSGTYSYTPEYNHFTKICPIFAQNNWSRIDFGIHVDWNDAWLSSKLLFPGDQFYGVDLFNLIPVTLQDNSPVPIQSGHCVKNFNDRRNGIADLIQLNLPASSDFFHKTSLSMEYLYEAYYFVPMLAALDQQKRGQFEAALDWYRTIYDYTRNVATNRKIFYGLILEESLTNIFSRPEDWLLDPLNPHLIAQTRANAYTRYTVMNIVQCLTGFADREFTIDTSETVPRARQLYTAALDLLRVNELNLAADHCEAEAHCFPDTIVTSFVGTQWQTLFNSMQNELGTINDPGVMNETRENIIDVFEDGGLTTTEQFAQVFELIADAKAGIITTPSTVGEVIDGAGERMDDALRFIDSNTAIGDITKSYMKGISDSFDQAMSNISGISVHDLNDTVYNNSVLQLANPDPDISSTYTFQFTSSTGVQQLADEKAYNPLNPTGTARQANLEFTNTLSYLWSNNITNDKFIPIIDYQFCNPVNPVYDSLKLKANVELYKIQNCRNIAGLSRELDVYSAPTDSTTGIPVIGAQGNLVIPTLNAFKPSQYRFAVLIERAKQLVQQTQQIESQFLAAMEKRDAEFYNLMKARQDLQTANATIKLQDLRIKQANDERRVADIQLNKAEYSESTFNYWINAGLNAYEVLSLGFLSDAIVLDIIASSSYLASTAGFNSAGVGQGLSSLAIASSQFSSLFSQIASYERRNQEWQYQHGLAKYDVSLANQQIKISDDNIRIVSQEREIAQLNSNHANDTLEFLKNKFTNAELYSWMSNVLEGVYAYMLNLSTATARIAEGQLYFERQEPSGPFILSDYWENSTGSYITSIDGNGKVDRLGLTGSARLLQDITRLDQYAFDTKKRKLQLTKTISLAQNFPEAFQQFRETGVLNFELTNDLFDHDFPGHYLRLINNVKTSVIGLVPVYGGIKASLTADPISYVVIGGNSFQRVPINRVQSDSVALTSPSNATGLFDMQSLNGELLNPFEAMGVESKWEFKLPHFSNRMNYDSIADVIITIDYTALDSSSYRTFVLSQLDNQVSFSRAFSFKNNFPDQWYELGNVLAGADTFEVNFQTKKEDFPAGLNSLHATRLIMYFVRETGFIEEVNVASLSMLGGGSYNNVETLNGILNAEVLITSNNLSPFQTWKLKFDNTDTEEVNRHLFLDEKITDILFVITCNSELPPYI